MAIDLDGAVALVTGGANGIGTGFLRHSRLGSGMSLPGGPAAAVRECSARWLVRQG